MGEGERGEGKNGNDGMLRLQLSLFLSRALNFRGDRLT